jgi:cell wall-associated NlpC family hydrolase
MPAGTTGPSAHAFVGRPSECRTSRSRPARHPGSHEMSTAVIRMSALLALAVLCAFIATQAIAGPRHPQPRHKKHTLETAKREQRHMPPHKAHRPKKPTVGERAARIARRYLGVPYVYGGAGPGGFDCSGLVMYVYSKVGVSLPHHAASQYGLGRPVRYSALKPGDLVFFSGLGHVGLYVGKGRFVDAPQSGDVVRVRPLAERRDSYVGARRIASA